MNLNESRRNLKNIINKEINKINTSIGGIILSYNHDTNRATVQPSGVTKFTDGRTLPYPRIDNVPVVFPTSMGGTCGMTFPLNSGDGCLIVFSQDNMQDFLSKSDTDDPRRFQITDAICIPGLYTGRTAGVVNNSGDLCLFYGGSTVSLGGGGFVGKLADGTSFSFSGGDLVVNGISLVHHVHGGIVPGGGNTAEPK